jgi:cellulose synthase/poly-beta-1,6-N-acetylglucosamine synthase-like glycosyltransferase
MSHPGPTHLLGFVPAYNAAGSVRRAVASLRAQVPESLDVTVIDDASTDETVRIAREAGARVVSMPVNSGRGAVRARGIELLEADLIVSLDSGNQVPPDFVAKALPHFDDPMVGAVVGHWWEAVEGGLTQRWRARHLFRVDRQAGEGMDRHLSTHGCILRRSAVLATGNFDPSLRHTEDAVLGYLMQQKGFRVVGCPSARVEPQSVDGLPALVRRYWRWQAGSQERWSFNRYFGMIKNALLVMAPLDWRARDFPALALTLIMPHCIALYTLKRKWLRQSPA